MPGFEWTQSGKTHSLNVSALPGRKSIALWCQEASVIWPLAYFRSEEDAQTAWDLIKYLAHASAPVEGDE